MPFLLLSISRFVAAGLLLISVLLPWFCVPVSVRDDGRGGYAAVLTEAASTPVFKVLVVGVLLSAGWIAYRRRGSGSFGWATPMAVSGCLLFVVLTIAYPALTIQRCAAISAHAAWLQTQNASIIRVSGDVRTAQEYAHQPGEWEVCVKDLLPRAFVALPTPVSSFSEVRFARLPQLAMWLGFSPAFYEFARAGWFCGIFGSSLLIASCVRVKNREGRRHQDLSLACRMPLFFILGACLLWALCLLPVVMAGRELENAHTAVWEGHYRESLRHLNGAEAWMPVLAYHTDAVYQRGWLDRKLGVNSGAAQLASAIREETEGFESRAAQHYADLLEANAPGPVRDEAFRGTLRKAINDFNAGLLDRAALRLTQLLEIDPTSLKANYALQLADLRSFRKDRLECEIARFIAVYRCFQSLEKGVVIAAAHHRLAELDFDSKDLTKLGDEMRASVQQ
jgi:hypothetical protein